MKTQRKHKIIALVVSLILVAVLVLLFFLDTSSAWDAYKIFSCVVCSIWTVFLPPAVLYFAYKMKNSAPEYSVRLGVCIGAGCFIGLLIAPYYGVKSYLSRAKSSGRKICKPQIGR